MCVCVCVSGMSRLGSDDFVNILTSDFNWHQQPTVAQAPWDVKPAGNQTANYQTNRRHRYAEESQRAANNKLRPQFLRPHPPTS